MSSLVSRCRRFWANADIDMDLVVLIDDPSAGLESSHLVQMMGDLLERVSGSSHTCCGFLLIIDVGDKF